MRDDQRIDYALYIAGCADTVTLLTVSEVDNLIEKSLNGEFDEDIVALLDRLPQETLLRAEYDRYRRMEHLREMQESLLYRLSDR